jgi:hypothetical protein
MLVILFLLLLFMLVCCYYDVPRSPFRIAIAMFLIGSGLVMLSFFIEELAKLFFVIGEVF